MLVQMDNLQEAKKLYEKYQPLINASEKFCRGELTEEDLVGLTDEEVWDLAYHARNGIHPLISSSTSHERAREMLLSGELYQMYVEEGLYLDEVSFY